MKQAEQAKTIETYDFGTLEAYPSLVFTFSPIGQKYLVSNDTRSRKELLRIFASNGIRLSKRFEIKSQGQEKWVLTDPKSNSRYDIRSKKTGLHVYKNRHVINQILDPGLCVRCGACGPACPPQILRFNKSCFPEFTDEEKCPTSCNRCLKVCPGEYVDLTKFDQTLFGKSPHPESISGIVKQAIVTFSLDDQRRELGTSGGFVTQFLVFLLEQKLIDGALVLSVDSENGWREKPIIARSVEEIERATKSKYMVSDYLTPLKEIEEVEGNYAVVGLPCFIHALHKYQKVSPKLRDRVVVSIGLFCNSTFEPELFEDVCKLHDLDPSSAEGFHFRHGAWPGGLHIEKPGGHIEKALKIDGMRDEFNLLKFLYKAPRCNLCTDYSAEYADVTVGDPWLRDQQGEFIYKDNKSVVLIRTERGEALVNKAISQGYLNSKEIDMQLFMTNFENIARFKRSFVPRYIKLRQTLGMSYPQYNKSFPTGNQSAYLQTMLKAALMRLVRYGWIRRLALRIAQTAPAQMYFRWNNRRKDRYYVDHYQELVKFVKRFM